MGKLGTATPDATAVMADLAPQGGAANGPEDPLEWDAIDWRCQEEQVQRLQQRIFKAAQAGDTSVSGTCRNCWCATRRWCSRMEVEDLDLSAVVAVGMKLEEA